MSKKNVAVLVSICVSVAGVVWWLNYSSTEKSLQRACLSVLAERLRSPATLQVVEWSPMARRPASKSEAIGEPPLRSHYRADDFPGALDRWKKREDRFDISPPDILYMYLEYDAANAYGTPVRGYSECSYIVSSDPKSSVSISETGTKVDGFTAMGWSVEQHRKQQGS